MMTDKEVIMDGINVAGCKYFKTYCRIATLCDYPGHLCEVTPNCYYKQLKRKEQEVDRLKSELDSAEFCVRPTTDDYIKEIAEAVGMTDIRLSGGKYFYTSLKDEIIQRIKTKEQELKELKAYIKEDLAPHAQRLQAENEELKEKYKWYDHYKEAALFNKDLCDKKSDEIARYKQTLGEIKDTAKRVRDKYMKEKSDKKDYYNAMIYGFGGFTQIMDKINEVQKDGR